MFEEGFEADEGFDGEAEAGGLRGEAGGGVLDVGDAIEAVAPLFFVGGGRAGGDPDGGLEAFEQRAEAGHVLADFFGVRLQLPIRRQPGCLKEKKNCKRGAGHLRR